MKDIGVTHSLRIYDAELLGRLNTLAKSGEYRNNNEFLTELLKLGYESYATDGAGNWAVWESLKELHSLLSEAAEYLTVQSKTISLYHELCMKLLSSNHRMLLALSGGEKVLPSKVEDGFYDELPERFGELLTQVLSPDNE